MIKNHLMQLFFQFFPEVTVLSFVGAVFLEGRLDKKKIFMISFILSCLTYLFRNLSFSFGCHTIISLLIFVFLLKHFYNRRLLDSFISALKTYMLLMITEIILFKGIFMLAGIPAGNVINGDFKIRTIVVLIQSFLIFVSGLIILYFKKRKE